MSTKGNTERIREAIELLNAGDLDGYIGMYDPSLVTHGYPPVFTPDLGGLRAFYEAVRASFPGQVATIEEMIGEGDLVACRVRVSATHGGEFMGIPPTGRPIDLRVMTFLRFDGDRCVERWQLMDELGMMQQIGAIPPMGPPQGD